MIIGITGKSGTGKTTVANYLASKLGYIVIHGDELAHKVLDINLYNEVLSWFGVPEENTVDRKRLGRLLFSDKTLMHKYNILINEQIMSHFYKKYDLKDNYIIDWNFLPISDFNNKCDKKILLVLNDEERKQRVLKRDNITDEYFNRRDDYGLEYNESDFDFVLTSDEIMRSEYILDSLKDV
ncbi:MAG: dephospho-CoA kinase [Erysipelotrichales bacterium]|nr:dephospho-CoA kinase [Erysipelotrichales bacterium]